MELCSDGGTYGADKIADSIQAAGYEVMFCTFAALPQSCAASAQVLKILREERLCEKVPSLGEKIHKLNSEWATSKVAEIEGRIINKY